VLQFRGSIVALDQKTGAMLWKDVDMPSTADSRGDTAAARFGNTGNRSKARYALHRHRKQTTPHPRMWKLAERNSTANCVAADDFFDTALHWI